MQTTLSDLENVRVFVRVVETGSFTAAAKALGLPKSSVSRRVGTLEETLGARLLNRTTRKLSMTDAGALYFARASRALGDLDEAAAAVDELQREPRGLLRITLPPDLTGYFTDLIAQFMAHHPDVQVAALATGRRVDLVGEGFDLALRAGVLADSSMVARKLLDSRLALYASTKYLRAHGMPSSIEALADHNCLLFGIERMTDTWILDGPGGSVQVEVKGDFACSDFGMLRQACERHMGIARIPFASVAQEQESGLTRLFPDYSSGAGGVFAVYPTTRHLSPKVRAFIDFARERVGD